jgi:hypothetical protein
MNCPLNSQLLTGSITFNSAWGVYYLFLFLQKDGHTQFPAPLTSGATWNVTLLGEIGRAMGAEARGFGTSECWAPILGLAREPRWGRTNEEFSVRVCSLFPEPPLCPAKLYPMMSSQHKYKPTSGQHCGCVHPEPLLLMPHGHFDTRVPCDNTGRHLFGQVDGEGGRAGDAERQQLYR